MEIDINNSSILSELMSFPKDDNGFYHMETIWGEIRFVLYPPYVRYQLQKSFSLIQNVMWDFNSIDAFWSKYCNQGIVQYDVISTSNPGEKKRPAKPKELKGIRQIGSVKFSKASCPIYMLENDVYINHNDYFSPTYIRPEDIGTPLSYRVNKYLGKTKKEKFIYADNWGDIVLQRRAWIKVQNMIPLLDELNVVQAANVCASIMWKYHKFDGFYGTEWEQFFESIAKLILLNRRKEC